MMLAFIRVTVMEMERGKKTRDVVFEMRIDRIWWLTR